ncbi:hypothetical protein [Streptomyces sp. NPDC058695]|uniref:hypothetical protein n=1 Tax=Streptomyces sp. NPDC058695 TaxID=3346604 RepID=UPI00365D5961
MKPGETGRHDVTEARDSTGTFYPHAERITGWTENDPDAFLGLFPRPGWSQPG